MRPISRTSRKPRVVTRPTTAPRPSTIAFVTMVVPWATDAGGRPAPSIVVSPLTTPSAGFAGVVGTLPLRSRPDGSRTTRSVKVPPTSIPTLLRDDVRVEPLLPGRERLGARLVVHDVAALLPLGGAREHARLTAELRRHRRLEVRRPRLERGHELLLDLPGEREVDELVGGGRLLRARHHPDRVDADDAGPVGRREQLDVQSLVDQVEGVYREHYLDRRLARLEEVLAARVGGEERGDVRLEPLEALLALLPVDLVAALEERRDRDDVRGVEVGQPDLALELRIPQVGPALDRELHQVRTVRDRVDVGPDAEVAIAPDRLLREVPRVRDLRHVELLEQPVRNVEASDVGRREREVDQRRRLRHARLGEAVQRAAHLELHRNARLRRERFRDDLLDRVLPVPAPDAHDERLRREGGPGRGQE